MIINSIKMFAKEGIAVDIYSDKPTYQASPVDFRHELIKIILYDNTWTNTFLCKATIFVCSYSNSFLFSHVFHRVIKKWFKRIPFSIFYACYIKDYIFSKWLKKKIEKECYDYIFPVEAKSLIATSYIKNKIIYYNMELLDWSEQNPIYGKDKKLLKILEYKALKKVLALVIQSEIRAKQFQQINDFYKKIYLLPVASIGEPIRNKDSFLRDKFHIPNNKHVIIYSGNIMPWAKCIEMVDSVRNWPENFCFILHTWKKDALNTDYGFRVKEHAKCVPVHFSTDYLDIDELAKCLSSADVALMFYEPIDTNFIEVLFSSNKLAEYLKAGLPVITYDFPELKKFINEHRIGKTISTIDELPKALLQIVQEYDSYKKNVIDCYLKVFRFEKYFKPFFEDLYPVQLSNEIIK